MKYQLRTIRSSVLTPLLRLCLQLLVGAVSLEFTGGHRWLRLLSWGLLALCIGVTLITALVFLIRAPERLRRRVVVEEVEVGAVFDADAPDGGAVIAGDASLEQGR